MVVCVQIAPPDFDRMFGALADHTRRDIVRRAINADEGIVELASQYPMSFAAVQKHVAVLERARRHGLVARLIAIAREKGVSGYVGDGSSRWPAVHVLDAASLFRLAMDQAPAGSALHAVGDEGVPTRDIAAVIGRHLKLPTASVPAEDFGFLGMVLAGDQPASSGVTQELLGWRPVQPGLIADLQKGHYFG
jgi:nucleoside-diphosphate-sugar epimerase